jgi:hypothetical protein
MRLSILDNGHHAVRRTTLVDGAPGGRQWPAR